jgi:hypothetical protein
MRNQAVFFIFFIFSFSNFAQINAVTENGDEVLLNEDGTWIYVNSGLIEPEGEVYLNPHVFTKPVKSTFLLKSEKVKLGIWLDPKKWGFKKETEEVYEYQFSLKSGDVYGMFITEKIEIPLTELKNIALGNAKAAAPDIKLIKEEYRMVNGVKMLHLQMDGTIQGIKFTYLGYYYSNESGTVQLLTYSSQKLMKENSGLCEELLNGLVELK